MISVDGWVILIIFIVSYIAIFSEKVHRTTASVVGALFCSAYLILRDEITEGGILGLVDFDVIILLFGMMVIVGVLVETGFFSFVAIKISQFSKGNPWVLFSVLTISTAFLSMIVDNLTTVILFIPITIELARTLEIDPIPLLLGEAIISDVGGVATLVGDPPNVIIASYAGFSFNDFIIHLFPIVFICLIFSLLFSKIYYRKWIKKGSKNIDRIMEKNPYEEIKDLTAMKKTLLILFATIVLFVLHSFIGITPAFVAVIGAAATLLVNLSDPEKVMHHVEWSSLIFFGGLFIIVGCVDKVGLLREVAKWIEGVTGNNVLFAAILILWISALLTAFIDNIPMTIAMAPIIVHIGSMGNDVNLLWWALAMAVGFGGNATPIGSSANVVTVALSHRSGYPISVKRWMKIGLPLTIICLVIATFAIVVFSVIFK